MTIEVILSLKKKLKKIHLNKFIEKNSYTLKNDFLEIVENTAKKKVFNKDLRNFFEFNKYVNLWDLSHFHEKNIFKEDYINRCLQYLSILMIIKKYRVKEIILTNVDLEIYKVLKKYNKNINFKLFSKRKTRYKENFRNFALGNWLTALLIFLKNNIFLYQRQNKKNYNNKNLIISYFCHYRENFKKKSFFVSDHWKGLEKPIKKNFFYLNFFIASKKYNTYKTLKKDVSDNIQNLKEQNFLDNYFDFLDIVKIILYSFIYSCKFNFLYFILKNKKDSEVALLEISYKIQKRSFSGITCFENLKIFYALKNFFYLNPNIQNCLYLMENQSWEKILLNFCQIKKIISYGYIHATIPFWHLNYYQSKTSNKKNIHLPDTIFTVSKINLDLLIKQGVDRQKLKLIEALRYNWLNNVKKEKYLNKSNKVLVFGDYDKRLNNEFIRLIKNFFDKKKGLTIYFKPHPGDIANYNSKLKNFKIIYNLPKKLKFRFYIFSNSTSASAEFTHLSNNIAIFMPKLGVNLSPFKDIKQNQNIFFSNEIELSNIINSKINNKFNNFFYLNKDLIKWKRELNEKF